MTMEQPISEFACEGKKDLCLTLQLMQATCFGICPPRGQFPPVKESSFTRIHANRVEWNRPFIYPKVEFKCGGLCIKPPSGCCPLMEYRIEDRVAVVYMDGFTTAKIDSLPCQEKFVVLQHHNNRWACCVDGYRIRGLGDENNQKFVDAVNAQRATVEGTFRPEHFLNTIKDDVPFMDMVMR